MLLNRCTLSPFIGDASRIAPPRWLPHTRSTIDRPKSVWAVRGAEDKPDGHLYRVILVVGRLLPVFPGAAIVRAGRHVSKVPTTGLMHCNKSVWDEMHIFAISGRRALRRRHSSSASNLVNGDTNGTYDVFVVQRQDFLLARARVPSCSVRGRHQRAPPCGQSLPS